MWNKVSHLLLELPGEFIDAGTVLFGVVPPGGLPEELWLGVPCPLEKKGTIADSYYKWQIAYHQLY